MQPLLTIILEAEDPLILTVIGLLLSLLLVHLGVVAFSSLMVL